MSDINGLIKTLLMLSEKSANIARTCRQDECLVSLLTQEKQDYEKNPRMLHDFKTLVDVLVQQLIKFEIEQKYPEFKGFIYGEENNIFTNTLGNEVKVIVDDAEETTFQILLAALNGKEQAAKTLAKHVHSSISLDNVSVDLLPKDCPDIPFNELAIWIDPIDSTSEYISGVFENFDDTSRAPVKGLFCVAVLIGVFNRETGQPVVGVINQPFYANSNNEWKGRCFWGLSYGDYRMYSIPSVTSNEELNNSKVVIALSSVEDEDIKMKLTNTGFTLFLPSGAGYKLLCVILGTVHGYVLSKGTTYFWDTCACHAILNALGGVLYDYSSAVVHNDFKEISYTRQTSYDIKLYCNNGGLIAARELSYAKMIAESLK